MIIREATRDDLRPLLHLCKKVWMQLGVPFDTSLDRFRALKAHGFRIVVLYDSPPASGGAADLVAALTAALAAVPIATDQGPGYKVVSFLIRQEQKDKIGLLDALSLYALNIAASEGRHTVFTERRRHIPGMVYGRDHLGMDGSMGDGFYLYQWGNDKAMMERIFQRHPEWQLP